MAEAVADDCWCGDNLCLKILGFECKDKDGGCADVLDHEFAGRHIQLWRWILPEIHASHRRPEAEAVRHGGRAEGLLPEVVGKGVGLARVEEIFL